MKAIAATPGVPDSLAIVEAPAPRVGDDDVLVEVLRVGICGTDSEINAGLYGEAPPSDDYLIIGHEGFGRAAEVGSWVRDISIGDHVVASVRRPCPHSHCGPCRSDTSDFCTTGDYTERGIKARHGFLSQFYAEAQDRLIVVPDSMKELGVLMEPMSVVEKAIGNVFRIQERLDWEPERALVLGAGAVGLLATLLLRLRDIDTYVVDRSDDGGPKSKLISQLGAHHISTQSEPMSSAAREIGGTDILIEATGFAPLIFDAAPLLNPNGVMSLLGISGSTSEVPLDARAFNNSMVLGNQLIFGSVNAGEADFRSGSEHLQRAKRRWPNILERFITRRVPFDEYRDAFDRQPHDIKVVIEVAS